jgi:hypothetical protein
VDLLLIAVVGAAIGLFMASFGLVRREPASVLFGATVLAISSAFLLLYMLSQISD